MNEIKILYKEETSSGLSLEVVHEQTLRALTAKSRSQIAFSGPALYRLGPR